MIQNVSKKHSSIGISITSTFWLTKTNKLKIDKNVRISSSERKNGMFGILTAQSLDPTKHVK
jgi:hypothetical protein